MCKLIGFVAALSLGGVAAAQAQTELSPNVGTPGSLLEFSKQSWIARMQSKIGRGPVEREGVVALFITQSFPTAIADFIDVRETGSRCTVESELAPFEGSCRIFTCQQATLTPVSAGRITITGPGRRFLLTPNPDNTYDIVFGDPVPWTGGEVLRISARGSPSGFDPFVHDFHIPTDATLTSPELPHQATTIDRSQPFDFTWAPVESPEQARSMFTVTLGTLDGSESVQCHYPLTKYEEGQVPATVLSTLPATGTAFLVFDVRQERAEFLNRGRDFVLSGVANSVEKPSGEVATLQLKLQ